MADIKTQVAVPGARESGGGYDTVSGNGQGQTRIADGVVAKIAGMAAREIGGVHAMGRGAARMVGAVRGAVSGGNTGSVAQGVVVEVGEHQAAVDIDLVVEYGAAIQDLAAAVRRNVTVAVERMTGLEVTEINIRVDDIHLPGDDAPDTGDSDLRVR